MKVARVFGFLAAVVALGACAVGPGPEVDEALGEVGQPQRVDCSYVKCAQPVCAPGEHLVVNAGACCGKCVGHAKVAGSPGGGPAECACSGGHLDEATCGVFGEPWAWDADEDACVSPDLGEAECAYVEAKHAGDGSGSDLYNLGLHCSFGH
ncbi:MAG: hypothetical protein IT373_26700 [Polyangiaceae bacterium]|nr:hypothetical protein [Polyangiaceae bacterium]